MPIQNGDAGIKYCPLCKCQFEELQKYGDIVTCDNCEQEYIINIKK